MEDRRKSFGRRGEELAAAFLQTKGFRIIGQNWSTRLGEIDLIAERDGEVRFVEVKTRRSHAYGYPEESVTPEKLSHLRRAIELWLRTARTIPRAYQIDVIAISLTSETPQIEWFEGVS